MTSLYYTRVFCQFVLNVLFVCPFKFIRWCVRKLISHRYEDECYDELDEDTSMDVIIMSRRGIEERGRLPFSDNTAVISITDASYPFAELECQPRHRLRLAFDDVDGDVFVDELGSHYSIAERQALERKYHMFSDEQARDIAVFYWDILLEGVETIIIQCEHGQSRSAAVAAAIREFADGDGISIFADDRYYPNKLVYRKTLKALREHMEADCVSVE